MWSHWANPLSSSWSHTLYRSLFSCILHAQIVSNRNFLFRKTLKTLKTAYKIKLTSETNPKLKRKIKMATSMVKIQVCFYRSIQCIKYMICGNHDGIQIIMWLYKMSNPSTYDSNFIKFLNHNENQPIFYTKVQFFANISSRMASNIVYSYVKFVLPFSFRAS